MSARWIRMGSFFMASGILVGAFGTHALKNTLSDPMKSVFETAVRYQLLHGLGLFIVAWLISQSPKRTLLIAGWAFAIGILLFSGSLYLLALTNAHAWGILTPFGGLAFLVGWISIGLSAI